jgi:hypothetical protein
MNNSTNWWLAALVAVALSFGAAACGSGPEDADDSADTPPASDVAGEPEGPEGGGQEMAAGGGEEGEGEHGEGGEGGGGEGEAREGGGEEGEGEHGEGGEGEEGEESGEMIARTATWDTVRRGARLVLSLNEAGTAFVGTVTNTTEGAMCAVRVEVHLEGGPELGPTPRTDVPTGASIDINLSAEGETVGNWTAHPEMSACGGQ